MYVCTYVHMYVIMYVCVYVCKYIYVYDYICMYLCMCVYVRNYIKCMTNYKGKDVAVKQSPPTPQILTHLHLFLTSELEVRDCSASRNLRFTPIHNSMRVVGTQTRSGCFGKKISFDIRISNPE